LTDFPKFYDDYKYQNIVTIESDDTSRLKYNPETIELKMLIDIKKDPHAKVFTYCSSGKSNRQLAIRFCSEILTYTYFKNPEQFNSDSSIIDAIGIYTTNLTWDK
jgi:hypothetical protein